MNDHQSCTSVVGVIQVECTYLISFINCVDNPIKRAWMMMIILGPSLFGHAFWVPGNVGTTYVYVRKPC
ncbi:hypothetical protein GGS21DRAFT_528532 [Xylaria nigripes]|nr:hypothetical protein GGS21DRAFT_528532 [Xylaria nigripes]